MAFNVVLTSDFKKNLKHIAKKHRQVLKDVDALIDELTEHPTIGTDLGHNLYKIRLAVSGNNKGKSGGARVITYVVLINEIVYLAEIYLKSEHATTDLNVLIKRLKEHGLL